MKTPNLNFEWGHCIQVVITHNDITHLLLCTNEDTFNEEMSLIYETAHVAITLQYLK